LFILSAFFLGPTPNIFAFPLPDLMVFSLLECSQHRFPFLILNASPLNGPFVDTSSPHPLLIGLSRALRLSKTNDWNLFLLFPSSSGRLFQNFFPPWMLFVCHPHLTFSFPQVGLRATQPPPKCFRSDSTSVSQLLVRGLRSFSIFGLSLGFPPPSWCKRSSVPSSQVAEILLRHLF